MQENIENNSINIERIIDRFDKYMFIRRLNDNKITKDLHFSVGTISKSRKTGRDLSRISIEKILDFYKDLDPVWLKVGIGAMLKEPDNEIKNNNMKTPEIPEEKMELEPLKKQRKPVTPERLKELEVSCKRMQEIKNDFQMNNISKLERYLGVTHGIISNVLDMRNVISDTIADALAKEPHNYSYEWVMYGIEPKKKTPVKIEPVEKTESSQSEFIIELLKDKVKSLEEKVEERDKTIAKLRRLGGSGTIPKPIPETILSKKNG